MPNYPHQLFIGLGLLEFGFDPSQHAACIGRVSQQKPVHVVLSLGVQGDDLEVVELRQGNAVVSLGSQLVIGLGVKPWSPGLSQTTYQCFLSLSLVVVDIYRETFMVSHSCNHPRLSGVLYSLTFDEGEVQVVALRLLPDIVRSVVPSPQNQIDF